MDRVHVEHVLADTCWCRPRLIQERAGFVVVHNSLDGRERAEGAPGRADS